MDNNSSIFAWNPSLNQLIANRFASSLMSTWGGSYGSSGQVLTSQGSSSSWAWSNVGDLAGGIPSGIICLWEGSSASIPTGWTLCDGTDGTPNLVSKFVVGAKSATGDTTYPGVSVGAQGGTAAGQIFNHTHSDGNYATNNPGNHTHNDGNYGTNATGNHSHGFKATWRAGDEVGWNTSNKTFVGDNAGTSEWAIYNNHSRIQSAGNHSHNVTGTSGGGGGHTHNVTGSSGNPNSSVSKTNQNLPPYYALCYIMKE